MLWAHQTGQGKLDLNAMGGTTGNWAELGLGEGALSRKEHTDWLFIAVSAQKTDIQVTV